VVSALGSTSNLCLPDPQKGDYMDISKLLKQAEKFTTDNSPAILTGIGIAGVVGTAYLTAKATVKAVDIVDRERSIEFRTTGIQPWSRKQIVLLVWKFYIPPVTVGVLTIASIYGANHVGTRRATAMAAAYSISEKAFSEYKEKVVEKLGEKKEQAVHDEIAQERVEKNPVTDTTIIVTGDGDVLCYELFTGRYFKSSMETLKQAANQINYDVLHQGYASLTDFYHEVGLPRTGLSDELGWNTDQLMEINFSTVMSDDNRPCIAFDYNTQPYRRFDQFG
jgi:hypothetical protein